MALPAHSKLSASASSRWTTCPGSVPLSAGARDRASYAALEGTALHAVMEKCLLENIDANDVAEITILEQRKEHHFELTEEQQESVQYVLNHARGLVEEGGTLMTEIKVLYGRAIKQPDDQAFGTVDVAIVNGDHLHILDAKFGRRFVDPVENTQMLLYAIGMLDTIELLEGRMETVTMHISQPRLSGAEPGEGWTVPRDDMNEWVTFFTKCASQVELACKEQMDDHWKAAYLKPSEEACHFCRAAAYCPALRQVHDDIAATAKEAADPDDFEVIATDKIDLGEVLKKAPLVEKFLEAVKTRAMADLLDGKEVAGYKLIEGRQGNRKWGDEKAVASEFQILGPGLYTEPKIKTPAQLEKALRDAGASKASAAEQVNKLTVRDPAKPSMVPVEQPGKPWVAEADFDIVN